jgi:branched-subunit amino acid aminotransferase/4-amino-4-deoxychorismate lyase
MSEQLAYVNGRVLPISRARVSVMDRGLLYGDGLFETIGVRGGGCVRLDKHLERLHFGAGVLGFADSLQGLDIIGGIAHLLDATGLADARVRVTVTRGESDGAGLAAGVRGGPTVVITAQPLPGSEPAPARVIVSSIRRDEASPLSSIKSLNYLPGILAQREAAAAGADDALLLNTQGNLAEGTAGNLFLVLGDRLITPGLDQGPLPGTVRAAIIELAPRFGLEVVEGAVTPDDLFLADELFLTNAIQLARPVCEVSGQAIGDGSRRVCDRLRVEL